MVYFFLCIEFLHSFSLWFSYLVYIHLAQESTDDDDDGEEEEPESEKSKSEVHDDYEEEEVLL